MELKVDIKLSVNDNQLVAPTVPISAVLPELVSKETFETSDLNPKRKAKTPKKESAAEKAKKTQSYVSECS
jgi:hypothetical protein